MVAVLEKNPTMKTRGTISALDVQQWLHDDASAREWSYSETVGTDGLLLVHLYAAGELIGTLRGAQARANADLITRTRNTLPEHIAGTRALLERIRLLEDLLQRQGKDD